MNTKRGKLSNEGSSSSSSCGVVGVSDVGGGGACKVPIRTLYVSAIKPEVSFAMILCETLQMPLLVIINAIFNFDFNKINR